MKSQWTDKELQARKIYATETNEREKMEKKRKARPQFIMTVTTFVGGLSLKIMNVSYADAYIDRVETTGNVSFLPIEPVVLTNERRITRVEGNSSSPQPHFSVSLYFHDAYGNKYAARAKYIGWMSAVVITEL